MPKSDKIIQNNQDRHYPVGHVVSHSHKSRNENIQESGDNRRVTKRLMSHVAIIPRNAKPPPLVKCESGWADSNGPTTEKGVSFGVGYGAMMLLDGFSPYPVNTPCG